MTVCWTNFRWWKIKQSEQINGCLLWKLVCNSLADNDALTVVRIVTKQLLPFVVYEDDCFSNYENLWLYVNSAKSVKCQVSRSLLRGTQNAEFRNNSPVSDENDFNQILIEFGNIENKIKNRLKQNSDNEKNVEFQNTIETIKKLIQYTDKMLKISTKRINRFYEI